MLSTASEMMPVNEWYTVKLTTRTAVTLASGGRAPMRPSENLNLLHWKSTTYQRHSHDIPHCARGSEHIAKRS
jgi:hypothetical protein